MKRNLVALVGSSVVCGAAMSTPASAQAQSALVTVAPPATQRQIWSPPKADAAPSQRIWQMSDYRLSTADTGGQFKSHSFEGDIGDIQVLLSSIHTRRAHPSPDAHIATKRASAMGAGAAIALNVGKSDSIGLFGTWTRERRKQILAASPRRNFASIEQSAGLSLNHENRLFTSLAAYRIGPSGSRSPVERILDLAGGGPRKASGVSFTFTSSPFSDTDRLSYGFDLRQQRAERNAFGQSGKRANEAIGSLFFRAKL